ncbi:MAG: M1 family metallopeptidase [Planctomycetes bacterium]|nr:M1 family metallopeptidase [Planctomycetota bacterium]
MPSIAVLRQWRSAVLFCLGLSVVAAALPAQRGRDEYARHPGQRPDVTIFSELDLPAPNRTRTGAGAPGPDYWQQQVDYRIDVELLPDERLVRGKEHVVYHNNSPERLTYLWVHLEQNILRKDSIGTLTEGGAAMAQGESDASEGVMLSDVSHDGKALEYQVYDTLMRVHLPTPLAPGARYECDIAWSFHVPQRVFRRYGTMETKNGVIWELAQWFPAVAVFDDVHGWNTLPYLGTGEFYTNYGDYELNITAPRDHIVVASGVLQNPTDVFTDQQLTRLAKARQTRQTVMIRSGEEVTQADSRPAGQGPLTWRFKAEQVRTVAWASSPAFVLDAATTNTGVLVQSAYAAEYSAQWSKSTAMLCTAIEGYSRRLWPYPYPVATNVGGVEGGMEYPMIIFCSGRSRSEQGLYGVTTHEIGHNWFPMMVNTDERRHAWMDEGFNTFINIYSTVDWFEDHVPGKPGRFGGMLKMPGVPIVTNADRLNGMQLGMLQYEKTGVGLQLLREVVLGPERFDFAFRTYVERWRFKSPQPADFFRSMEDAAGMDLAWFFRGWFLEDAMLDQAVDSVRQPTGNRGARITIVNKERMVMPLDFEVTFEDGTIERFKVPVEVWAQSDRIVRAMESTKKVVKVHIDPDGMIPDVSRDNNLWEAGD